MVISVVEDLTIPRELLSKETSSLGKNLLSFGILSIQRGRKVDSHDLGELLLIIPLHLQLSFYFQLSVNVLVIE